MKNQYFADINDYRKYGMLRILAGDGVFKIAICWMLTPDDGRNDGAYVSYLTKPAQWQHYDPALYSMLVNCMAAPGERVVKSAEELGIVPGAVYHSSYLYGARGERLPYFQTLETVAAGSDLVFFDPDNGIEVKSVSYQSKQSHKYIYWQELVNTYEQGHSLLIYQHFVRVARPLFTRHMVVQLFARMPAAACVYALSTAHVLFLLVAQHGHANYLQDRCAEISTRWKGQIGVERYDAPSLCCLRKP